jgi:uncharacterized protein (DUF2141 family)
MTTMMKRLLMSPALTLALAAMPLVMVAGGQARAAEPGAAEFTFEVGERTGAVMVALFDSDVGYQKSLPVQSSRIEVNAGSVKVVFRGLKPGRYAAKVFHDVDDDGAMDVNAFDMPTEPFAFSNNAPPRFGAPAWSAAAFEVGAVGAAQTLVLR